MLTRKYSSGPIVVALGGNALNECGRLGTDSTLQSACKSLAEIAEHGLIITHGNGPQIGLLDKQQSHSEKKQPLDIIGAETEGWLGYEIERQMRNELQGERDVVSLLSCIEVDQNDAAMQHPRKPIGQWLDADEAQSLRESHDWTFICENDRYRRVVASPKPQRCLQSKSIAQLLKAGKVVICAGGGGIPVYRDNRGKLQGVEGVIDKDSASALVADELDAQKLLIATNVKGVFKTWPPHSGGSEEPIAHATPEQLAGMKLDAGTMAPKVEAAASFVTNSRRTAVIGHLEQLAQMAKLQSGTIVRDRRAEASSEGS